VKRWIRLNTDSSRDPRVGELADRLKIPVRLAYGMVVAVWCAMGEHAPDGDLSRVSDSTIDEWAGWRRGDRHFKMTHSFAAVFRTLFLNEASIDPDYAEQQGALVERAKKDRERMARKAHSTREDFAEISQKFRENDAEISRLRNGTERNGTERRTTPNNLREGKSVPGRNITADDRARGMSRGAAMHLFADIRSARVGTESPTGTRYHIPKEFLEKLGKRELRAVENLGGAHIIALAPEDKLTILRAQFADLLGSADAPGLE
jgi:hypothetical protein